MKRTYDNLWLLMKDVVLGDPQQKQADRIERAVRAKAQVQADLAYERSLAAFYNDTLRTIDPYKNWWQFADTMQKFQDHDAAVDRGIEELAEAAALLAAEITRSNTP